MAFFSDLAEELGARRHRLRKAISDRWASVLEFLWLGGLTIAAMRGTIKPEGWALGFLPMGAAIAGYFALDARRQAALRSGADPDVVRRRFDRLALILVSGLALIGAGFFASAYYRPPPAKITIPDAPPADARMIDLQ